MLTSIHRQRSKKLFRQVGKKMKKNRWFNWLIAGVLIALAALTAHQFAATAQVVSTNDRQAAITSGADQSQANPLVECPFTSEQIHSIHAVSIQENGQTFPVTKDGPMGVEGGLYMLRYCKTP
jgi:hypothetical protein